MGLHQNRPASGKKSGEYLFRTRKKSIVGLMRGEKEKGLVKWNLEQDAGKPCWGVQELKWQWEKLPA